MSNEAKKILVAMSGGVDSSVAAALLKEQGHEVEGAHMLCWDGCENNGDKQDAERVCAKLGIPFRVFDFREEYKQAVYDYMVREYKNGRTPNPDVMCNKTIKFGIFLKKALELDFDFIATGHYVRGGATHLARVLTLSPGAPTPTSNLRSVASSGPQAVQSDGRTERDGASLQGFLSKEKPGSFRLYCAADQGKDQSYFLWTLTQEQLAHSLFPVGDLLKSEVREIAKKFGLPNAAKKDSQGLCFVGKVDFAEFIREALPKNPGPVVDTNGKKIGDHDGAHFYTLGQRHGLNIGGSPEPLYVAHKDLETNTLVLAQGGDEPELFCGELIAENINWIAGEAPGKEIADNCFSRVRYRQPVQHTSLQFAGGTVKAIFAKPQRSVTPGQSVVFYSETGEMLGGGVIK